MEDHAVWGSSLNYLLTSVSMQAITVHGYAGLGGGRENSQLERSFTLLLNTAAVVYQQILLMGWLFLSKEKQIGI